MFDTTTQSVTGRINSTVELSRIAVVSPTKMYAASSGSNVVAVLDLQGLTEAATIPVGRLPGDLDSRGDRAYVANRGSGSLSVLDTTTDSVVATVSLASSNPSTPVLSESGDKVYVAGLSPGVSIVDTATNTLAGSIAGTTGLVTSGLALGPKIYFPSGTGRVQLIDSLTDTVVQTIAVPGLQLGEGLAAAVNKVYVPAGRSNDVAVLAESPLLSGVAPTQGPEAGGTSVTISGSGLGAVTEVRFGSATAGFTIDSLRQITAVTPPGTGTVDVEVVAPNGSDKLSAAFTYLRSFVVTFDPQGGTPDPPDQQVVDGGTATDPGDLTRTGFVFRGWYTAATGGTQWDFTTQVTADVDLFAQWVTNPQLSALAPDEGPEAGGTTVTITGTNLTGTTGVTFGGTPATGVTVAPDGSSLTAVTPAGTGTVDVAVTTPGATATLT